MKTSLSQLEATGTRPWSATRIDWLPARPEERERSIVLGDSAGLTEEDIVEKVRRVKARVQAGRLALTMPFVDLDLPGIWYLMEENASLRQEIEQIKQKLVELEGRMPEEKVIVLREISKEEAKQEIRQLFLNGRTLYYSDIAEELGLDLRSVVDICHELQESGEIGIDDRVS